MESRIHTVIGHVEGSEAGVGELEHGLNGVIAINTPPPATSLPHPIQDSANLQRIVPILNRDSSGLGCYDAASDRVSTESG